MNATAEAEIPRDIETLNGSAPNRRAIPVYVVLPPRTMLLDLAGPVEVLRAANHFQHGIYFDVSYVSAAPTVSTSIGIALHFVAPLPSTLPSNAIIMLIGDVDRPSEWGLPSDYAAEEREQDIIVDWLRSTTHPNQIFLAICSGALLLAKAGLLEGRACTTHFLDCDELAKVAPKAKVLTNRLYVQDGNIYSSAGVTAGIDLLLYFISRLIGPGCAVAIARYLVIYLRRTGSDPQLSPWLAGRNHIHPSVHRVQDAIAADPAKAWTRPQLARVAGASGRHLSRLFHQHVGMHVTEYRNQLRVALARELLLHSQLDMENIAERAGFSSTRQLRRAWRQFNATSPSEARTLHDEGPLSSTPALP